GTHPLSSSGTCPEMKRSREKPFTSHACANAMVQSASKVRFSISSSSGGAERSVRRAGRRSPRQERFRLADKSLRLVDHDEMPALLDLDHARLRRVGVGEVEELLVLFRRQRQVRRNDIENRERRANVGQL